MEHKGYNITLHDEYATYEIHGIGKGALPKMLQGSFMSVKLAQQFIDMYVTSKKPVKE